MFDPKEMLAEGERVSSQRGRSLVLDHSAGWTIAPSQRVKHSNLIDRARAWYSGLHAIARRVAEAERRVEAVFSTSEGAVMSWNYLPGTPMEQQLELLCDFDAFANAADCYVGVVFAVACLEGLAKSEDRQAYRRSTLGPLLWYRDKVAAHPAGATKHGQDSEMDRLMSVATRLSFVRPNGIVVGGESMSNVQGSHDPAKSRWGVTEVFSNLGSRYWPPSEGATDLSVSSLSPQIGVAFPSGGAFSFPAVDMAAVSVRIASSTTPPNQ